MRFALLATTALLIASPAFAGNWVVDKTASHITFTASQSGEEFTGTLPAFDADITFNPDDLANSKVAATLPLTGTSTGSGERDKDLPGEEWFDIAKFPTATFTSTAFMKTDATHYVAEGNLTLRGISQPVSLPFELVIANDKAVMTGSATFSRLLFEVGKNWPENSGVSETIVVKVAINATKAAEGANNTGAVSAPVPADSAPILVTQPTE